MDQTAKQSVIDRLGQANNVLVTVKSSPNVDELAACLGFTLFLNKIGKHATAVFSGEVPSTLEFLKPEETIEKNTDSLRDFIIALDKSKADKLRYKIEDKVVRIFITPYQTSLSEKDLDFSQGDFNVDVVVALGVQSKSDIDAAITAHGRILHDATVIAINNGPGGNIGTLNLEDAAASSLSEVLADLSETIQPDSFDKQTATAYLTGIVAETKRFSNEKTSPRTMSFSAKLMAAGANQQLIATKLQPNMVAGGMDAGYSNKKASAKAEDVDGTLVIEHDEGKKSENEPDSLQTLADLEAKVSNNNQPTPELPSVQTGGQVDNQVYEDTDPTLTTSAAFSPPAAPAPIEPAQQAPQSSLVDDVRNDTGDDISTIAPGQQLDNNDLQPPAVTDSQVKPRSSSSMTYEPPSMGGTLTANSRPPTLEPSLDPLGQATKTDLLQHNPTQLQATDSHQSVGSSTPPDVDAARQAVDQAASQNQTDRFEPLAAVGAQPLDMNVQGSHPNSNNMSPDHVPAPPQLGSTASTPSYSLHPTVEPPAPSLPTSDNPSAQPNNQLVPQDSGMPPQPTAASTTQPAPPPVPPPMMPPTN